MSDQSEQHDAAAHRWKPGTSGNPRGRPRGQSISAELRRQADPEAIAAKLLEIALSPKTSTKDVLAAIALIADRVEGKSIARNVNVEIGAAGILPADFDALGAEQRRAVIAEIRSRALSGALELPEAPAGE